MIISSRSSRSDIGLAVLVAGGHQQAQHVGAILRCSAARRRANSAKRIASTSVAQPAAKRRHGGQRTEVALQGLHHQQRMIADGEARLRPGGAQRVHLGAVVETEDGAQDDVERDALRLVMDRERPPDGPGSMARSVMRPHDVAVDLHALAVEGRHHQPALAAGGWRAVERAAAIRVPTQRREDDVRLAGAQQSSWVAREDRLDRGRIAERHQRGRSPGKRSVKTSP